MAKDLPGYIKYGLSERYWNSLTPRDHALYDLIRPMRTATYTVDHMLGSLEQGLASFEKSACTNGGVFELNPDFQRGHVWDEAKQVAYVENLIRGVAPRTIKLNCAGWNSLGEATGDLHPNSIVCVDGLQRLTAVRRFIAGEIKPFGLRYDELYRTAFHPASLRLTFEVFDIKHREELLQFYLDLNSGGVVHSEAELERVRGLLAETKARPAASTAVVPQPVATEQDHVDAPARQTTRRRPR